MEALLDRRPPSAWSLFLANPTFFLSRHLHRLTTTPTGAAPALATGSSSRSSAPATIVCISDTHNATLAPTDVPPGDVLIHAGDATQSGRAHELQATLDWLAALPHPHKLLIAGNHDLVLDPGKPDEHAELDTLDWHDVRYLDRKTVTLTLDSGRALRVYGDPRTPRHGNGAFQYPRADAVQAWAGCVPEDVDVIVTHGPPAAHCDWDLGCRGLLAEVWRVRPRLLVCGHVHVAYGCEGLRFDGVQRAWERVVAAKGGFVAFLVLLMNFIGWLVWGGRTAKTLIVNAAHVGGFRDNERRAPVVVTI
jgi:calcineurin-like phosphoesterase family protein